MPEVPGCLTTSSLILQCASQHTFLAILTHNPLWKISHICHGALLQNKLRMRSAYLSFIPQKCALSLRLIQEHQCRSSLSWQSSISQLYAHCMQQYVLCEGSCNIHTTGKKQKYAIWKAPNVFNINSYSLVAVPCPHSVLTAYRAPGGQSHQIPKREESTDVTLMAAIRCIPKAPI